MNTEVQQLVQPYVRLTIEGRTPEDDTRRERKCIRCA